MPDEQSVNDMWDADPTGEVRPRIVPREVKPLDEVKLTPATPKQIANLLETFGSSS